MEQREIVGSRGKTLLNVAISFGLVLIALWTLRSPGGGGWAAWVILLFFGLMSVVSAWLLVRPQRLFVDRQGFTLTGGLVHSPAQVR